jgi:2-methylisocitrate lyase-like PEP mutase family enzyme
MENSNYRQFKQLHHADRPLLLPNAWDAKSARVFEQNGFKAIATSSAAVANALGYEDGEQMPFDELFFVVKRIAASTQALLTVDIEGGYGDDVSVVCENIYRLAHLGVAGINIEDSAVDDGGRKLLDAGEFAGRIAKIKAYCSTNNFEIFINLRTDPYLLGVDNRFEETVRRIEVYDRSGADGIFIPCLGDLAEMKELTGRTTLPVNVMAMPNLPDFVELQNAGIRRISMGPFMFEYLARQQSAACSEIERAGDFKALF